MTPELDHRGVMLQVKQPLTLRGDGLQRHGWVLLDAAEESAIPSTDCGTLDAAGEAKDVVDSRSRSGLAKQNQSVAFARLIHQRFSRQTATRNAVSNPSRPSRGGGRARHSGAERGLRGSHQSTASKRARKYCQYSKRGCDEDDEQVDEGTKASKEVSIFSSGMSCVLAFEPSEQHSNRSSSKADSDEDSIDSESPDDRWSLSRANSVHTTKRGKLQLSLSRAFQGVFPHFYLEGMDSNSDKRSFDPYFDA
ncbi:hypothetical protein T265_07406 [Opisthorchis viverrini]|uniref:Uncharacterized protein n=1 Tax=Opisthorchis viverrini TaxID=6198 RepID=A0A074ZP16_OPIVI|nr:hypothetical protein T265_07406 [Opisthorchis viverrini]KER25070.1 hypothetical protein T265_07406 [Opisthorchis viverrini]